MEALLVGVFSVTLKSRPTIRRLSKAKNRKKRKEKTKEGNIVTLVCCGNTQEVSGDQRNSMLFCDQYTVGSLSAAHSAVARLQRSSTLRALIVI